MSVLIATIALLFSAAPAQGASGPPYDVPLATMAKALRCTGNLATSPQTPVLLIPGTTLTSDSEWSWTWDRSFDQRNWAHCDVDLPQAALGDIQVAAEYVTYAIRTMHAAAKRKVSLVGHSQGGMVGRWSLKYWPDTRAMVDDYVALSPSNHGTIDANALCTLPGLCAASIWQQRSTSAFLRALNTGPETWPGISYTVIRTNFDEIVVPSSSGNLTSGPLVTNTSVQTLCPLEVVDHLGMSYDGAAWRIGLDALTHAGPARLSRIPVSSCLSPIMPGVNLVTFPLKLAAETAQVAKALAQSTKITAEPALKAYAR